MRLIAGFRVTQSQLHRQAGMLMGMLIDRQRHSALRQLFTGGSVTFMGDPTALAVAAVASQRLRHLRVAQPGIVDAHHVAVAAQGLFQQAVDPLPVVLPASTSPSCRCGKRWVITSRNP